MRTIAYTLLVITASAMLSSAQAEPLALRKPTIVILTETPGEIAKYKEDDEFNEFSGDFSVYANRMQSALKPHKDIKIRWSSAALVTFPGTQFKPVQRRNLEAKRGYVFYRPGKSPLVIDGIAPDDQLVCTASKLYEIKVEGYACST